MAMKNPMRYLMLLIASFFVFQVFVPNTLSTLYGQELAQEVEPEETAVDIGGESFIAQAWRSGFVVFLCVDDFDAIFGFQLGFVFSKVAAFKKNVRRQ